MPRVLLFAPCERVLIEEGSSNVSIINLLQTLTSSRPLPDPIPENAVAPQRWTILSILRREDGDDGVTFDHRVTLENPRGATVVEHQNSFTMTTEYHRNIARIDGFPMSVFGQHLLKMALRRSGGTWEVLAEYPIALRNQRETLG